jgi:hypothetical protein
MNTDAGLGQCLAFINCQLRPERRLAATREEPHLRAVTLSRQAGCGALAVAEKLAELLQPDTPVDQPRWTVFDRNLMEKVLEDHHLPARLAKFLPEDRVTEVQDIADELFGLRPTSWTMIEQTSETILRLAELGNVILIGRGGNIITSRLSHVLNVRLVAPLERRIAHARQAYQMNERTARAFCQREDEGRRRYVKKYFKADTADPLLYHLVLNTGLVSFDEAARLIAEALRGPRPNSAAKNWPLEYPRRGAE